MANRTDVLNVMKLLLDAYPTRQIHNLNGFVDVAAGVLQNVPTVQLFQAAQKHVAESKWFPTIAELHERATRLPVRAERTQKAPMPVALRDFVVSVQRFETLRPEDWGEAEHAEFVRMMGRPVRWESEPVDAPWMAWKICEA